MRNRTEPQADKMSWIILAVYLVLGCAVIATSRQMEGSGQDSGDSAAAIWMFEITSHAAIVAAALIIPALLSRFPLSIDGWRRQLPVYFAGFIVFAVLHILLMVGLRSVLFPVIEGGNYHFGLLEWRPWIYEIRKDFLSFATILTLFLVSRYISQTRLEMETAKQDARQTGRIALTSGGRKIFIDAASIDYVKASGNYVEVFTDTGQHFVRMTLASIEGLLIETGLHIRIHRSYLIRAAAVQSAAPTGSGEAVVTLASGAELPVSRKFRPALESLA